MARKQDPGSALLAEALSPVRKSLRRAGGLSVAADLLWIGQAGAAALALGGLLTAQGDTGLPLMAGLFVLFGLLRAICSNAAAKTAFDATDAVIASRRRHLVQREVGRRSSDPHRPPAADTATLAAEKLEKLAPYVTRYLPARIRVMASPLVILAVSAWFSWAVALILLIAGPLIPLFMALVGMAARTAAQRQMAELSDMNVLLLERLNALLDIRLLGAGNRATAQFRDSADALRARTMEVLRIAFLSSTVLELFSALGVAMVAVFVGFSLLGELPFGAWASGLSPSEGIFLLLLAPEFFQPLRDLSAAWHDKADAEAVMAELADRSRHVARPILGSGGQGCALPAGPLQFRDLRYSLPDGRALAIPNITLPLGESLAILGPSGSGKSTLLRLLAGLDVASSGQILWGDVPLSDDTADRWRASVGWIPQEPQFMRGSLRANLGISPETDPAALSQALALAAAQEVVDALPRGLDSQLGQSGAGVSGGEARRLLVARAALRRPQLLLADEPTADLDQDTARLVTQGLLRMRARGTTLIVATHDPVLAAQLKASISIGDAR